MAMKVLAVASCYVTAIMSHRVTVGVYEEGLHGIQVVGGTTARNRERHDGSRGVGDGGSHEEATVDSVAKHTEGVEHGFRSEGDPRRWAHHNHGDGEGGSEARRFCLPHYSARASVCAGCCITEHLNGRSALGGVADQVVFSIGEHGTSAGIHEESSICGKWSGA
jgi:hypothetical protein